MLHIDSRFGKGILANMAQDSREFTAFTTPFGLFEFLVMPFGLHTASATFQRLMNAPLRECQKYSGTYLDDVVNFSNNWDEHLHHLEAIFNRIQQVGLTVKPANQT